MSVSNGAAVAESVESAKALVPPGSDPAKEGSLRILPVIKRKRGSSLRQVLIAICANLGTINTGMAFGFPAVANPQLRSPDSSILIDADQASWLASLSAVTTPIGCILSGYLMDAVGRKRILVVTQVPTILGWLLIAFADSIGMIYAGRLLVGLGSGMVGAPARVYVSEATQPHLRGVLAALASVGVSLGVTIEYILGATFAWKTIAMLSSIIPILALIASFLMPESPSYLARAGRLEECRESLKKLRGATCDIDHEVGTLLAFNEKNNIHKPTTKELIQGILHPSALKPFFILSFYFLIYQFSGVNPITFYAVEVFQDSGATLNKYLLTVILGVVRVFFTLVGCGMMRVCGRRSLTFLSSIGCGLTMIGLGSYMYLGVQWAAEKVPPTATWFPVLCILTFTAASTIGYLVVPWVMIGEVYPVQVRGVLGGMTTCIAHLSIFLVVKTFPLLQSEMTKYGTFWLYGGVSLLGTIFFYSFLPETKGRSLQEIEDYFSGRTKTLAKPKKKQPSPDLKRTNNNRPIIVKTQKSDNLP